MRFSRCCNVMSWIFPALVSQSETVSCLPASRTRVGRCDMTVVGLARCPFFVVQPKGVCAGNLTVSWSGVEKMGTVTTVGLVRRTDS